MENQGNSGKNHQWVVEKRVTELGKGNGVKGHTTTKCYCEGEKPPKNPLGEVMRRLLGFFLLTKAPNLVAEEKP